MAKRRNENGQMRREEYEAANDDTSADSFEIGFQRASEESIRKRKIVKARTGSRPPVVTKPKAATAEDNAAKSNPFGGFQGLTATKPAASNPFAGFAGLTGTSNPATEKTSNGSSESSSISYQQPLEGLNKAFLTFVTDQLQRNPSVSWVAAVQDYLRYAAEVATKHAFTKPVAVSEIKEAAPAPCSFGATPASASTESLATAPSSSSFSFGGSKADAKKKDENPASSLATAPSSSSFSFGANKADAKKKDENPASSLATAPSSSSFSFGGSKADAKKKDENPASSLATAPSSSSFSFGGSKADAKKDETPASSKFSSGGASKKDGESKTLTSGGFSFGGAGSLLFSAKPSDGGEKTTPAFSFGALLKPAAPVASSTPATGGFSLGNAAAPTSIASASSGGFKFGASAPASAPAALTSASTAAGDEDENIGHEEATVIIKADSPDDDCTFEADKVKIFEFKKDEKRWADKGVHPLKVLVSKDKKSARILVRNEIGKVVLNSALYKGMAVRPHETKGKKTGVKLALQVNSDLTQFLIKVNAARVDEFIKALESAADLS